jgi:hypothetical protein
LLPSTAGKKVRITRRYKGVGYSSNPISRPHNPPLNPSSMFKVNMHSQKKQKTESTSPVKGLFPIDARVIERGKNYYGCTRYGSRPRYTSIYYVKL